jgi:hypothetical protein
VSDVIIYHPETQARVAVPEEAVPHHRRSGWVLLSEHEENEAARAEREAATSKASVKKGDL